MHSPLDLRFVTVVGKGGVGKSTVSAALALAAAARGKRVLVAMCNSKERLSHLLEVDPVGPQVRTLLPDVDGVNIEPGAALEEYGMMVLKVRALYRLVFENRLSRAFLRGTPGLEAWAMLGKAQFHAFQEGHQGQPRYDLVILDAPATGHGLDLLRVPKVIVDVVPPGPLRKDAERAWELFTDPQQAGVLLVTLPEELPVNETLELHASLRDELGLPVCGLVINRLLPRLFDAADLELLEELGGQGDGELSRLSRLGLLRGAREARQAENVARLEDQLPLPYLSLADLPETRFGRAQVQALAEQLRTQLDAAKSGD